MQRHFRDCAIVRLDGVEYLVSGEMLVGGPFNHVFYWQHVVLWPKRADAPPVPDAVKLAVRDQLVAYFASIGVPVDFEPPLSGQARAS